MRFPRLLLLVLLSCLLLASSVWAQADPASEFFAAYQEFQRAEKLEREGRGLDALAKFRYVSTELSQIKTQSPSWQPMIVDFRLKKTQEAIQRLEGSSSPSTLGPPPDLVDFPTEDKLPPVQTPRTHAPAGPTISISVGDDGNSTPPPAVAVPTATPPRGNRETPALREQLAAAQSRNVELEQKVSQGESEVAKLSAELEQAREKVRRAEEKTAQAPEGGAAPPTAEMDALSQQVKELGEKLGAAQSAKETAEAASAESTKQIEVLNTQLAAAREEADAAKKHVGEVESERDEARQAAEQAKGEVTTLTARVSELEEERTQLVAARDSAQKEADEAKAALEKNAELIEANRQLEQKLTEATEKINGMENDVAAKAEMIGGLKKDLDSVREELTAAQTKLKDDRGRFDKLQAVNEQLLKEYDQVTGALAAVQLGDVTAGEAKLLQQENEVLRGIIMRQIQEQARREQAFRLAQEEVQRLEIKSDTLNDRINELAKPTLELTEAEQEMLKRPVVTLLNADAAKMSAQVTAIKPAENPPHEVTSNGNAVPESSPSVEAATPSGTEASAAAESLSAPIPPALMALVDKARGEFVKGNFAKAEELYQKFLKEQPDNVIALANLGVAQFRQGKLTAAQLALEKAVKVEPKDAFSLTTLGAVLIEQGRIQDALDYLERANASSPDNPITLNYLGVASSQLGQFGKAEQSLRRAITVDPGYAEAHFNLAVIYATAKPPSIALAKRHYEKALELGSNPDKRLATMLQSGSGG